jgi:3-oxoacyl-[acyl-carrier-protein] synthase II
MREAKVVITGVGIVSPIGIGREAYWASLMSARSGVGLSPLAHLKGLPLRVAAQVQGFDAKAYVANRKSLKLMSRDAQLGVAAASLACGDAGIAIGAAATGIIDPARFGVVLGADLICASFENSEAIFTRCMADGKFDFTRWASDGMHASYPLDMLRVLPNMIASHVSIAVDARGPNNTIHENDVSGAMALAEAVSAIDRGMADIMLAGGASSQMHIWDFVRRARMGFISPREDNPASIVRPFDLHRDGQAWGEGAAIFVLESVKHARARGAKVLAQVVGMAGACEPARRPAAPSGAALRRAIDVALRRAEIGPADVGVAVSHGVGMLREDSIEAHALNDRLPDVPVTALKGYMGNLGAAGSLAELASAVIGFAEKKIPAALNSCHADPSCPVNVVRGAAAELRSPVALGLSWNPVGGQAAATVLAAAND